MSPGDPTPPEGGIHPIEARSYEIMASRVDLLRWPAGDRDVVARMIHATADESFATSAHIGDRAVAAATAALAAGAAVICDARMVVAGIPRLAATVPVLCYLDAPAPAAAPAPRPAPAGPHPGLPVPSTRSAAAVDSAAAVHPDGALWVIGNAPTALFRLLELHAAGRVRPAAVIGVPVGYVGAAESKAALWASPLAPVAITNEGRRGGSPVAAAAVNALARLAGVYSPPR